MISRVLKYMKEPTEAAPLAVFRILFGLLMMVAMVRFYAYGWISKLYIEPKFFFSYYGFDFVKPIGSYTSLIFVICFLSALSIFLGYRYRIAIIVFFISFTYIELMDKATFLNHYYFVSVIGFVLIFLPANATFSLDAFRNNKIRYIKIPRYNIFILQLIIALVYFYSGLAKINSDWLIKASPINIWLPSRSYIPVFGGMLQQQWTFYFMSWGGLLYDISIPFLLFYRRTRSFAFIIIVVFHVLTRILFPIGLFPYVMILCTLIFFHWSFHKNILLKISRLLRLTPMPNKNILFFKSTPKNRIAVFTLVTILFFQIIIPFRYLLYPGELLWTEEGFRFSWRVMLMEKTGYANFKVSDPKRGIQFYVQNSIFLTPLQEKQMSTQPDLILQYAHFLKNHFQSQGIENPEIYVESYVSLNGRGSHPYIDPKTDLTKVKESFKHKTWILPFNDDIKGF